MRSILSFFLLLGSLTLSAQSGNYFLSHYSSGENQFDNVCFDMVQDKHGLMYFATRGGIQQFDGRTWKLIQGNGAVYSLEISSKGDIIWSGASGYGKLETTKAGVPLFTKLSEEEVVDVFQNLIIQDRSYFVTEQSISVYDFKDHLSTTIRSTNFTGSFLGVFELFGTPYLNTDRAGVVKIENGKFVQTSLDIASGTNVIFSSGSDRHYLLGLSDNKVYLCSENMRMIPVKLEDSTYVDASVIISGSWVNRDLVVLGTLRGGMVFVNPATGKTQEIINYNTGLPDNEIYTLMVDKSQGIWAAHEYGFTRVAPYLPYRSFGHYPGLSGNLLCAASFKGNVYVGTSLGLYKLEREDIYEEIVYYIDVEVKGKTEPKDKKQPKKNEVVTEAQVPVVQDEPESKKKGFFRFLRRSKGKTGETTAMIEPSKEVPAAIAEEKSDEKKTENTRTAYKKVKKSEKVLRASQFVYRKVSGVEAKVTQLIEVEEHLIAVGLAGAYQVQGSGVSPILEEPIRMGFSSVERNTLFLSTYSDEIKEFQMKEDGWQPSQTLENLDDQITTIFEGVNHELWLLALDKAYRLDFSRNTIAEMQTIEINNPNFDEVAGIHLSGEIIIANSQGFFRFDRQNNAFVNIDSLSKPLNYFGSHDNMLFKDSHSWHTFSRDSQSNLQLLNLLKNPRFVHQDKDADYIWIITGGNELYKFFGEKFTPYEGGFPLVLKGIIGSEGKLNKRDIFEFDQEKSTLTFEVIQPDYLASQAIEYRYQLQGLDNTWSDWSTKNNTIDYAYLPAGDFTLMVQARDIFGKIKDLDALSFEVLPPYWQRPWFYALEFFVFAALVLLSFRLSNRFRIISRLLSLLTIIMLIQFIQTVIGETFETKASPVLDFFVQVVVAFMILPVEGYLRNLMLRSLDSQSKLYRFLSPKGNSNDKQDQ
jgi:hypothetical protein